MGVTIELDVREDLRQKREPFEKIMNAIKPLQPGDTFILHAPFKPLPLFPIMKAKGFTYEAEQIEKKHWKVTRVLIIQNYTYAFHKFGHTQTKQRPSRISNREEAAQRKNGERTK